MLNTLCKLYTSLLKITVMVSKHLRERFVVLLSHAGIVIRWSDFERAIVDLIFFSTLLEMRNSRAYVDRARARQSFLRIPQWLLCTSLGYFHFSSPGHVTRYCHSPRNAYIRSCALPRSRALAPCAHVGNKICVCVGGSVGLPYIRLGVSDGPLENGCVRTSLTRIGCSSCRTIVDYNHRASVNIECIRFIESISLDVLDLDIAYKNR